MTPLLASIDLTFKTLAPRAGDWQAILPEICVAGLALFCLIQAMILPRELRWLISTTARTGLGLLLILSLVNAAPWNTTEVSFAGLIMPHLPVFGVRMVFLLSALLTSFVAEAFLRERQSSVPDYHHVLLVVTAALMLLGQSNHFVTFFVCLETAAVGLYILVGYLRRSAASLEAGVKYLVMGGLSSALLLMGIVLVYGSLGGLGVKDPLNFVEIQTAIEAGKFTILTLVGVALILGGAAFKLGAFPFHTWIPDVYQGAPTPTTALLATASKAAGAFSLFLLVNVPFHGLAVRTAPLLAVLAVITILAGNLAALATTNIKRVLALSGVSHAGFLLAIITVSLVQPEASAIRWSAANTLWAYLIAYIIGTFLTTQALVAIPTADDHHRPILSLRKLLRRSPILAGALGFGLSSLAGVPPTVGFAAKLLVLILLVQAKLWWVLGAALIGVTISIHYYFSILREAVIRPTDDQEEIAVLPTTFLVRFIIGALATLTVLGSLLIFV
jgi:NADH-quinone oxidoreductase subunit N